MTGIQPAARPIEDLVAQERTTLVGLLACLDPAAWSTPSLCTSWTVRDVVAHLLMPYEASTPKFLLKMVAARFDFDTAADRWARSEQRSNAELVEALRATAERRFNVPGAPAEAPLSHLVVHAEDILRPLGHRHLIDSETANTVLTQLTSPRASRSLAPGLLDGLSVNASDTGWSWGSGAEVSGSASALITTLAGRPAALDELTGPGSDRLRARLAG
jgi:uncharacterized protein (TIGR03083 family)